MLTVAGKTSTGNYFKVTLILFVKYENTIAARWLQGRPLLSLRNTVISPESSGK
jgi:hypothetical protein